MAQDLIAELHRLGIRLRLTNGRLDVLAPPGALTPELRDRLRQQRDELISLLRGADEEDAPLITPQSRDRHQPFPLTDIQHAYWVGRGSAVELGGVSSHYYFELERDGLDPVRLTEALRKVIARHDMLRMTVQPDGRQQVVAQPPQYEIQVADLREMSAEMRDKELSRIRAEMDHQVLPGDRWPLFDIRLSRLTDQRSRLHVSLDVLILDGFSLYMLFGEWRRFYEEPDWQPEPLAITYRDYVVGQPGPKPADEEYWLSRLDTLPPAPAVPLATTPAQLARTEFTRRAARMSKPRWSALKQAAQQRGLTPSSLLMATFAEVMRRWSGQPSFTLNLTLFNRPPVHPQINQVIGDFTSVTLLEVQSPDEDTFTRRAERLQQQLMRDLPHASYSGVRVLRERARRLGGGPGAAMPVVFTSALVLGGPDEDPSEGIRFFGDEVYALTQTPQVWLDCQIAEERGELVHNWDVVEALFPAGVLDDMFAEYCAILERLVDDPAQWDRTACLADLPGWQADQRRQVNDTAASIAERTMCDLVTEQAERTPDATAVIAEDGQLTYRETLSHARRLARRLADLGAERDTLIAVVLDKGRQQVPAVLGVQLSGAGYLPIDPQWPAARRAQLLERGGARLVVTSANLRDEFDWPADVTVVTLDDDEVRSADDGPLATGPAPEDLAYVIFTSGSTGQPKGVAIDHRSAANTIQDINSRFEVGPRDRVLGLSALSFDLSVYDIFGALAAGAAVVFPAADRTHEPAHWTELVARHQVTVWNSVPALMQLWVDEVAQSGAAVPSTLRVALLSGDWIPVGLPDAVRAVQPDVRLISLGGATEGSIWSIHYPIGAVPADWTRIPYGRPLANQTMHVLDPRLDACPVWTTGEIYIGGVGVAREYWGDPERTAERFVTHPVTGQRLYRTGDLGRYLPSGDIEFLGRQDNQVKLNGYRIELGEINAALRQQTGVGDSLVTVAANPVTGRRQLVAYVVPDQSATTTTDSADASGMWQRLLDGGSWEVRRTLAELDTVDGYREVWQEAERLCPAIMARTLSRLGHFTTVGDTATAEAIVERHGLKPGYVGLIEQWMSALAAAGVLVTGDRAGEYRSPRAVDPDELDREIGQGFARMRAVKDHRVLVDYLISCADNQIEMLRGTVSPLQLLVPNGNSAVTTALYADNPVSYLQNKVTARIVRTFVDRRPPDRPVRILEVGAGTGATTAQVLQEMPPIRVHYLFTDISTYFTERAKPRFNNYVFVNYGVFDIDRDPVSQGIMPGSADLIIAANVLHDAKDLDRSLRQLRSLLSPGGVLVMIEGTVNSLAQTISVGFIEGLGHYQDQRELPLLSVPQWHERLRSAGFARSASVPEGEAAVDVHVQHVIVAGVPDDQVQLDPEGLRAALEEQLPEYMVPRHYLVIDQVPLSANGKVDPSALPSPWTEAAVDERVAPRDDMERALWDIWRDALGRDDFGVEDTFFELGGDSLHAVSILGRLRAEFDLEIGADEGLGLLFDSPTIASLAQALREFAGN